MGRTSRVRVWVDDDGTVTARSAVRLLHLGRIHPARGGCGWVAALPDGSATLFGPADDLDGAVASLVAYHDVEVDGPIGSDRWSAQARPDAD